MPSAAEAGGKKQRTGTDMLVVTIAVFLLFVILSTWLAPPTITKTYLKGETLEKNTKMQIVPGERYDYKYSINGTSFNISYGTYSDAANGTACTRIILLYQKNNSGACFDSNGNEISNSSTDTILFFKPWMLALHDGWMWEEGEYLAINGIEKKISTSKYKVERKDSYNNRTAFVVSMKQDNGYSEGIWIDSEKRIMVLMKGQNYEITLLLGNGS